MRGQGIATRVHGGLIGLAVGDALGGPLEFTSREKCRAAAERGLEMTGGGPLGLAPGQWTDDSAMALCLAESIGEHGLPLDVDDVARRYIDWAGGPVSDIGLTVRHALVGARHAGDATKRAAQLHERTGRTAGNGTVMRCAPIGLATADRETALVAARADAVLTHFDPVAGTASGALCAALIAICDGADPLAAAAEVAESSAQVASAVALAAARDGSGIEDLVQRQAPVCWTTLAVGLFAVSAFDNYADGVTWAIALFGDPDTQAAVAGALLGCRDGVEAIPERWRERLQQRERVERASEQLLAQRESAGG